MWISKHMPSSVKSVRVGKEIFIGAHYGLDPASGNLVDGSVTDEATACIKNLFQTLQDEDVNPKDVVVCRVYITETSIHDVYDPIYHDLFPDNPPARVTVTVGALPGGARIAIEAEAVTDD